MSKEALEVQEDGGTPIENVVATPDVTTDNDPSTPEEMERARRMGWVPKEEFRGDPARWMPARQFLAWSERSMPIMRERYDALDRKFANQERQLGEVQAKLAEATAVMGEFRDFAQRAEARAHDRAKREIEARMEAAVATNDHGAYRAAKSEFDSLAAPVAPVRAPAPPPPVQPAVPQVDPATAAEMAAWVRKNPWFNTDPELYQVAVDLYGTLERTKPQLTTSEKLAEVKRAVMALHPDRFNNPRRTEPSAVATPQPAGAAPGKKKKSVKDLPKEAQDAFARFKAQMPSYTEEEYLAVYLAGEEQ